MSESGVLPPQKEPSLSERVLATLARTGTWGMTQDELLRKLGVAYDDLMAALKELEVRGQVRVDWPTPDSFRVFYTA